MLLNTDSLYTVFTRKGAFSLLSAPSGITALGNGFKMCLLSWLSRYKTYVIVLTSIATFFLLFLKSFRIWRWIPACYNFRVDQILGLKYLPACLVNCTLSESSAEKAKYKTKHIYIVVKVIKLNFKRRWNWESKFVGSVRSKLNYVLHFSASLPGRWSQIIC